MKTKFTVLVLVIITLFSCDYRKSVSKDLVTGLTTKGDGLSCDKVYLSDGKEKISKSTFTYGEKIYLNFENIEGFKKTGEAVFPGLKLFVLSKTGDTVLKYDDLYADKTEGIELSPLLLQPYLIVAAPIHSNKNYSLNVSIWDKKGKGVFTANMDFQVVPNDQIAIEKNNIFYDEIYLYSKDRDITITDNKANLNENVYMIFEGLNGFRDEGGKAFIGLSMKLKDSEGKLILDEKDLLGDSGMELSELKSQLAPNFIITGTDIKNPVTCEVLIWDKKSGNKIKASAKVNVE